ncbi:asparagine synthase (glutamine-hydrolyzing) [Marinitenerispora sediminis]|uniref:asparagine synthase (glutamine-hydrolyzing) n=1 Tax=Marinitenerispora sediminis TaxID=1931232 RepID=A0A368T159_9ACTN|nr:asparagine synthase (glutamine-hydrolyzing) [Marinitenerispora sediminis]RCV51819.1 asparagine synthase (glutamine-hydrolyzing) [Marinitenerispora sediminis]RCV53866.1 asparagine synthase (glutamine-hydrolyzing) [Marinitenerispora sediminis]RCV54168.1 asparagine synthase (glutamine-hydrolyzing) [Marinitenerispora sediminis]
MCGITGWVDFERDLSRERDVLSAMTDTMACRGPDARGVWTGHHAAVGHRRLSIIDLPGGAQPMVAEPDKADATVLTYSGEVYNFAELRERLAARGHRFRTDSDTEVVLRGYLEWGESVVDRLNGMYAFAVWDARAERLLLVRDRMGIKPLFYHPTPHGVVFGSEPKALLANPLVDAVVDEDGLRELLGFVKTPERSVYQGIREVRPGHVVRVDREGVHRRAYWRLEAREHTDDLDTTVRTVRDLLEDTVDRQLVSDVPRCTLLSGGLDSSALTALAARRLRAAGAERVRSFAVDFAGYTEHFRPDELRETPDAPYVRELSRHVDADHTDIVLSSADLTDPRARRAVLRANDAPAAIGDMYTSLYLLFQAIRRHSTVALSGESADEVFGGYRQFHDPEAVDADTFPWLAIAGPRRARSSWLDPGLSRRLDLPGYQRAAYRAALAEVPHVPGVSARERRMREVCYLHLTRFVQILLDRKDRMSMANGLEVRVPFCDHRLVQYVFNTPWEMKTFDGREKSLLRAATRDLLPASVADRRKSPYPSTQDPLYDRALRKELAGVLDDTASPVRPLIDVQRARELLTEPDGVEAERQARLGLEMILGLDAWLREYRPELRLGG